MQVIIQNKLRVAKNTPIKFTLFIFFIFSRNKTGIKSKNAKLMQLKLLI